MSKRGANPVVRRPPPGRAYLADTSRIAVIFGAFALLALPLAALQLSDVSSDTKLVLSAAYAVLLGATHFLITVAVYFNSRNLRYFASSRRNVVVYFVVPAAILLVFFGIGVFGVNEVSASRSTAFFVYLTCFTVTVKGLDYLHVVRQSYGVLQLFKAQHPGAFPGWMRKADNAFFLSMASLQQWTFIQGALTGRFVFTPGLTSVVLLGCAGSAFVVSLAGFVTAWRRTTEPRQIFVPFAYFLLQGASASLPAMRGELYSASLAMHYVEYHVIIFPRLFRFDLDPASRVDRVAAWMRRHKMLFYVALALLAVFIPRELLWPEVSRRMSSPGAVWVLFNLFSGVTVMHYFVEAFIWKFRIPYYRESLAPAYFAPTESPLGRQGKGRTRPGGKSTGLQPT